MPSTLGSRRIAFLAHVIDVLQVKEHLLDHLGSVLSEIETSASSPQTALDKGAVVEAKPSDARVAEEGHEDEGGRRARQRDLAAIVRVRVGSSWCWDDCVCALCVRVCTRAVARQAVGRARQAETGCSDRPVSGTQLVNCDFLWLRLSRVDMYCRRARPVL